MKIIIPFVIIAWAFFIFLVIRGRQRIRNSFVLLWAIYVTLFALAGLFGENMNKALVVELILISLTLLMVPILLVLNGKRMTKMEGGGLANKLSLLMGLAIAIGELCFLLTFVLINPNGNPWYFKLMAIIGWSAFYFCVVFLSFVLYVIAVTLIPHLYNYDYIIIHGSGLIDGDKVSKLLSERLDKAIRVYDKCMRRAKRRADYSGPILIPSGGKGDDEKLSEAEAMASYLIEKGIPEERIIQENASPSTETNLINSKKIIDSKGGGRVALVSSNYHVYRCIALAKRVGLSCVGVGARVAGYFWPSAVIREFVAVFSEKRKLIWLMVFWIIDIVLLFNLI